MKAKFMCAGKQMIGEVLKSNYKTIWVKVKFTYEPFIVCWMLGRDIMVKAYILFKVSSGTEREVSKEIANFPEVVAVGVIYGEYDLIAQVSVQDMKSLEEFIAEKIRAVSSVLLTSTMIIAREYRGKNTRNKK